MGAGSVPQLPLGKCHTLIQAITSVGIKVKFLLMSIILFYSLSSKVVRQLQAPDTILDNRNVAINKTDQNPTSHGTYTLVWESQQK